MSLEALVSLRQQGETELKQRGDILVVKLAGSPWGNEERRIHQVVQWDDPELETQLKAQRATGEPHPVIAYPYAEYGPRRLNNEQGQPVDLPQDSPLRQQQEMVSRSSQGVDVEALPEEVRTLVLDSTVAHPLLHEHEYSRRA